MNDQYPNLDEYTKAKLRTLSTLKSPVQDLKDIVLCILKMNVDSQNSEQKTSNHSKIKFKIPNPIQEIPVSFKTQDLCKAFFCDCQCHDFE